MPLLSFWWCGICVALSRSHIFSCSSSCASLFSSCCWPFCAIQRTAVGGSEMLTVGPDHQLLCSSQQLQIQLFQIHAEPPFLSSSVLSFTPFWFFYHNCNPHLLKLFVVELPFPVTLVWIQSKSAGVIGIMRYEMTALSRSQSQNQCHPCQHLSRHCFQYQREIVVWEQWYQSSDWELSCIIYLLQPSPDAFQPLIKYRSPTKTRVIIFRVRH